ncbi:MAG: ChaN family lipoprotein [Rhodobacteraceae bacterium]|nr:ChaN family lipoprotein [Paracoccaceae bacterium]
MKILIDFVRNSAAFWGGAIVICVTPVSSAAAAPDPDVVQLLATADVVILGEVHDNPAHHQMQADILTALAPKAVVWEMITQAQADGLAAIPLSEASRVSAYLDWAGSGWPEFGLYAPVFAAAKGAQQFGGLVSRSAARAVMEQGAAEFFGPEAAVFGLDKPLPEAEHQAREADQMANHCDALPVEMLPLMVEVQRLRDTVLADAVVQALQATGGPVVVITGNGHARKDRGVPVYLAVADPEILVLSLGQAEAGQLSGIFDLVLDAKAVARPDPCLAFQ